MGCSRTGPAAALTFRRDAPLVLPMAERVSGWLLLLCRLLVVFHPLSLAVTASNALSALSVRGAAVASIHLRALLTDLFLIDEVFKSHRT